MTFTGMATDINAALEGLQYAPAIRLHRNRQLQITTNDLASAFAGGPKVDSNTIAINVSLHPIADETLVNTTTDGVQQTDGRPAFGRLGRQRQLRGRLVELQPRRRLGRLRPTIQRGRLRLGRPVPSQHAYPVRPERRQRRHARRRHFRRHLDGERRRRARHGRRLSANATTANGNALQSAGNPRQQQQHGTATRCTRRWRSTTTASRRLDEPESRRAAGTCSRNGLTSTAIRWKTPTCNLPAIEFQMNSTSSAVPIAAQVAMDQWGYTLMVWQTETNGQQDILCQVQFFLRQRRLGHGARSSWDSSTEGDLTIPAWDSGTTGEFVLTWTAAGRPSHAQRYDWCARPAWATRS